VKSPLLAIKIGNSNVTVGFFENSNLIARWRAHTETNQTADEYALLLYDFLLQTKFHPSADGKAERAWRGAIIVSVVPPLTTTFQELCRVHLEIEPLVVGPRLKIGMPMRYDNPRALGADRLVAAVGAKTRFGVPVIIIDFGTATTFNAVNRSGEFIGGAIAPGLYLAADALYRSTAQLPHVDLAIPPHVIATNTTHAIQSGILFGYVGMIEGMVKRMREELGEPNARVVATGGLAGMLVPQTRIIDELDPDLILHGLRIIYDLNRR
jgi:type III pantothenate kinase